MKNIVISPAIDPQFIDVCSTLKFSKKALIELAVMVFLNDKDNFVVCPSCLSYLAVKSCLDIQRRVKRFHCGCGTTVSYDPVDEKIIGWEERQENV